MNINVKVYSSILCASIILVACTYGPGYSLKRDDKKNNGSYICSYESEYPPMQDKSMYFSVWEFKTKADAELACKKAQKQTKSKYRCSDYLSGYTIFDGTSWGSRMYDKCIANNSDNCYSRSYSFAHCIAAKCNYKGTKLQYKGNSNNEYDIWIKKSEWDECWNRNY